MLYPRAPAVRLFYPENIRTKPDKKVKKLTDLVKVVEKYETEMWEVSSSFLVSYILSTWIIEHYYILGFFCLILVFGLMNEGYRAMSPDNFLKEIVDNFAKSKTGKQVILLFFVGSAVWGSLLLRDWVEYTFGTLAVVQMLGFIVILSRVWVNLYSTDKGFPILDGQSDTYATYSAGFFAIVLSWVIRESHAVYTMEHNVLVIWPSLVFSYLLFYHMDLGGSLKNLENRTNP